MFYYLLIYSFFTTLFLVYISRDITFLGRGIFEDKKGKLTMTDQEKMLLGNSKLGWFYWPSKIHDIENSRGQLREIWTILSNFLSKLFKSKDEFVNVFLSLISNFGCSILIYFILNIYFSNQVAFFGAALYATSLWPYQICLYFGHILLAQFFFLLSILFLGLTTVFPDFFYPFLFVSGFFLTICFSSSSASRKYPPVIIIFLLFVLNDQIIMSFDYVKLIACSIFIFVFYVLYFLIKNKLLLYIKNKIEYFVKDKDNSKQYYINVKNKINKLVLYFLPLVFILISFLNDYQIIGNIFVFFLGLITSGIFILYPKIFKNIGRYYIYLNIGSWANHFKSYPSNFFKVDTSGDFRAPINYYIPFLLRFTPVVFLLYIFSFLFTIFSDTFLLKEKFFLIVISVTPFVIIEASKAIRVAKSYLPILIGMIILIVPTFSKILNNFENKLYLYVIILIILLNFFHKVYYLFTDLIPTRLGPSNLAKFLLKNRIFEFGTYNNPYNDELVGAIKQKFPNKFKINYFESISDSNSCRFFIVPQRSSKSVTMETQQYAIKNGDFKADEKLNEIEKNGLLEQITIKKFKTMGCSKFYVGESEITGFREFCLKDISKEDRKLGYALVLDLKKLNI